MKQFLCVFLSLALLFSLSGCGNEQGASSKAKKQSAGVAEVLEQGMSETNDDQGSADVKETAVSIDQVTTASTEEPDTDSQTDSDASESVLSQPGTDNEGEKKPGTASSPAVDYNHIDVDLTVLSATLVYSEVYNMKIVPEEYIGKTVKMKGPFSVYHDDYANKDYFACIIQDATACCAQGMEFAPTDDYTYPDDFPAVEEEICVVGVFDTYEEGGCTYCTLRDATIIP